MRTGSFTNSQYRHIGWVLAIALFVLTILPAHYHLHHAEHDVTDVHEHFVDMHIFPYDAEAAHHPDAQILKAAPDGIVKNLFTKFLPLLLLAVWLACFAMPAARRVRRTGLAVLIPTCNRYPLSPPLRGPPAPAR